MKPCNPGGLRFSNKALFSVVVAIILALALFQSRNFGYRAGLFPGSLEFQPLLLCLAQLSRDLWGKEKPKGDLAAWEVAADVAPEVMHKEPSTFCCGPVGFFISIWLLGFSYSIPVSMILYLKLAGKEKWPMTIIITFFTWLFIYGLFERVLSIPIPDGLLVSLIKGPQLTLSRAHARLSPA